MSRATFEYGKLLAGEANYIIKVPVSAGTYKVGDVLECVATSGALASTYAKATADAKTTNAYVVCNEDVTAEANDEVVCIKEGYFNKNIIKINDKAVTDASAMVLASKNIFVTEVQK